jgi:hypothetical protein
VSELGPDDEATAPRRVELDVPACSSSLRVIRLVAADAVADSGAGVEHIERSSLVVDELAAILISEGTGDRFHITLWNSGHAVEVEGRVAGEGPAPTLDPVATELLALCVGDRRWSLYADSGTLCFRAQLL